VKTLRDSQGLTLFTVVFMMACFLLFVTGGLVFSRLETKKVSNTRLATQALEVADAGLQHALALLPWAWNFNAELNCGTPPCSLVPQTSFPSGSGFGYSVTAENDPADLSPPGSATNDSNNILVLNSTASGPAGTQKVVQAYVKRSLVSFTPPGALYFPASSATIKLDGDKFFITGDDTAYNGSPASNPKPSVAGIATIYDAIRDAVKSALGSKKYDLVQGAGYTTTPTVTPSINTTSNVFDVNQIALNFYNQGSTVKFLDGLNVGKKAEITLGTDSSPQITYIRESLTNHIHLDGNVTGSGVLVIEGKAHIYGDFEFRGLVIRVNVGLTGGASSGTDDPETLSLRDKAKIFGGLIVGPTKGAQSFDIRHDAKIYYSSQAMTMVNNLCPTCLPQPARIFAWLEK